MIVIHIVYATTLVAGAMFPLAFRKNAKHAFNAAHASGVAIAVSTLWIEIATHAPVGTWYPKLSLTALVAAYVLAICSEQDHD